MAIYNLCLRGLSATLVAALGFTLCQSPAAADNATVASADIPAASADVAQASNPFADVPANHWAYDAVRQLAADGYIQGYPDGQFKGQRPMTRYEVAVLTDRAVRSIEAKMAQMQQVEQRDIAAVRALVSAFGPELAALKSQVAALNAKTDDLSKKEEALKAEADATQLRVNQGKVGFSAGWNTGTSAQNISVVNGGPAAVTMGGKTATPGNAFPTPIGASSASLGTGFSYQGNSGGNAEPLGPFQHGVNYFWDRFYLTGQVDPRWSYGIRMVNRIFEESATGTSSVKQGYCTSPTANAANCNTQALGTSEDAAQNGSTTLYLDFAYVQYNSPGGVFGAMGRVGLDEGHYNNNPVSMFYGGQSATGAKIGYNDPAGRLYGYAFYAQPDITSYQYVSTSGACSAGVVGFNVGANEPVLNGLNPGCSSTPQEFGAFGSYWFPSSRTAISGLWNTQLGTANVPLWDPAAQLCTYGGAASLAISASSCVANGGVVPGTAGASGAYISSQANYAAAGAAVSQYFGNHALPQFNFEAEYGRRLGSDPFTGAAWQGANTFAGSLTFASKGNLYTGTAAGNPFIPGLGKKGSNVAQLFAIYNGINGIQPVLGGTGGTPNDWSVLGPTNAYSYAGQLFMGARYDYWVSDSMRFGITALHDQLIPGVTIPADGLSTTATASCPGCYVNSININQFLLDGYFYFN